ncbi:deferrochelatase/peroxidase EfeB, partial [Streptosporangium canum]
MPDLSRRRLLTGAGIAVGAGAAAVARRGLVRPAQPAPGQAAAPRGTIPIHRPHPAGDATPGPAR